MATILAHITVRPGMEGRFEQLAADLWAPTHERETGVRRYEYFRGAAPGSYYTMLAFDDFLAFLAHQTSAHHEAASPALGEVIASFRLEWLDPVQGASDLPPTAMQALPGDADDLARSYHALFAAEVQAWWEGLRGR